MCEQRQQFSSVSSANSVSSASSKSVNRASNTQRQQLFATCSPVSRRNHHCHGHLQISLERIFRRSSHQVFTVYWSTPVVWLHCAVFVPVLFRGIFSGPRRRCLQIQGPRLVRAATPGVPVSVVCVCIVCTFAQRPSSGCCGLYRHRCIGTGSEFSRCSTSSCYYAFVAVLRVSMHIIVGIVRVHLLSGPVADMRCGPQPKGSPQQRQVY